MEILPVFGQSENRATQDAALAAQLQNAAPGQVYYTYGMKDELGDDVPISGAGWNAAANRMMEINRSVPATGFAGVIGHDRVSPAYTFQYLRAMDAPPGKGVLIADHGYGGRYINEWIAADASPIGRNQNYWADESARLAAGYSLPISCPYVFWWQGMSAKTQAANVYSGDFAVAWSEIAARANSLFGAVPKPVLICNGADSNSTNDPGQAYLPDAQYKLALDRGGIIAMHQRTIPTTDGNGHPNAAWRLMVGETAHWAVTEVEAGRVWNTTYTVEKSGATVTVTFALRPGETLTDRTGLYDAFGGASTCLNYGFEADGGIASVVPNLSGNTVTVTLSNSGAAWFRFARQSQDVLSYSSGGLYMSAHRTTLFPSETKASVLIPGETLWRSLPSFNGTFSGGTFVPAA